MSINMWLLISNFILIHSCIGVDYGSNSNEPLKFEPRIIGGTDVKKAERPFQVSLQRPSHYCGGTIINQQYILTAAHCVEGEKASEIKVVVGTIDLKKPYRTYQASKIIIHEQYAPQSSYVNDIALIKVSRPIVFDNVVKPVRLPKSNMRLYTGDEAVVSGWGYKTALSPEVSDILQEAEVKIVDVQYCQNTMAKKGYRIYPTQVCAFNEDQRKGHCKGDSGGPLTLNGTLIGIVSWSIKDPECGSTTYPAIYTQVSKYINWINEHTSELIQSHTNIFKYLLYLFDFNKF